MLKSRLKSVLLSILRSFGLRPSSIVKFTLKFLIPVQRGLWACLRNYALIRLGCRLTNSRAYVDLLSYYCTLKLCIPFIFCPAWLIIDYFESVGITIVRKNSNRKMNNIEILVRHVNGKRFDVFCDDNSSFFKSVQTFKAIEVVQKILTASKRLLFD